MSTNRTLASPASDKVRAKPAAIVVTPELVPTPVTATSLGLWVRPRLSKYPIRRSRSVSWNRSGLVSRVWAEVRDREKEGSLQREISRRGGRRIERSKSFSIANAQASPRQRPPGSPACATILKRPIRFDVRRAGRLNLHDIGRMTRSQRLVHPARFQPLGVIFVIGHVEFELPLQFGDGHLPGSPPCRRMPSLPPFGC